MIYEFTFKKPSITDPGVTKVNLTPDQEKIMHVFELHGDTPTALTASMIDWVVSHEDLESSIYFYNYSKSIEKTFVKYTSHERLLFAGIFTGFVINKYVDKMEELYKLDLSFDQWADSFFAETRLNTNTNFDVIEAIVAQIKRSKVNETLSYLADTIVANSFVGIILQYAELFYYGCVMGWLIAFQLKVSALNATLYKKESSDEEQVLFGMHAQESLSYRESSKKSGTENI